jgi:hypothetical protein
VFYVFVFFILKWMFGKIIGLSSICGGTEASRREGMGSVVSVFIRCTAMKSSNHFSLIFVV